MYLILSTLLGVYTNEYGGREMQDLGGGERTTGFELTEGVKTSGVPEICQEYSGTLRRNSMRECREGGLNMNFMESYFCQVRSQVPWLPLHSVPLALLQATTIFQQGFGRFPASSLCLTVILLLDNISVILN